MILGRNERIILEGWASEMRGDVRVNGRLYLSNLRIVFEAGAGGSNPYTSYSEQIENVWNVHAGMTSKLLEGRKEYLTVEGARGRFVFQISGAQGWGQAIVTAKTSLPPPAPPPPPPPSGQAIPPPPPGFGGQGSIVFNIPAPAAPQVMMHCRHCGNLYDATKGRCDRCGASPT
ncbi:MAG: hypothetical protein ACLPZM_09255 [Thermoplasmata archaeon]